MLKLGSGQSEATCYMEGTTNDGEDYCVALTENDVQKDLVAKHETALTKFSLNTTIIAL